MLASHQGSVSLTVLINLRRQSKGGFRVAVACILLLHLTLQGSLLCINKFF